jgi:hypothetical protein
MKVITMLCILMLVLLSFPCETSASEKIIYSAIYPGWGQIRAGEYGRGMIFAGGELLSLVGLFISDLQYSRAVDDYDAARAAYFATDYIGDAEYYYDRMREKWDDAENLHTYRNTFLGAAIGIWVINIVDMAIGEGEQPPGLSLSVDNGAFFVTKGFAF